MKEAEFLQKVLPGYYMNIHQNPKTLLPKFFAMFTYQVPIYGTLILQSLWMISFFLQASQKNIRLIVMNNLLPSGVTMHLKFDLKGSTFKRKVITNVSMFLSFMIILSGV